MLSSLRVRVMVLVFVLFSTAIPCVWAGESSSHEAKLPHTLALNIPLNSYIYGYLDKLAALGYLEEMSTGTKPYTRLQAARWVEKIAARAKEKGGLEAYATDMLATLEREFQPERAELRGAPREMGIALKEWTASGAYYHGDSLKEIGTKATWQPLNTNNGGYRLADGLSAYTQLTLAGSVNENLLVSVTPRVKVGDNTSAEIQNGYVKTKVNNMEIEVGKEDAWWGQGTRGGRSLTNNAEAVTSLKLSNMDAIDSRIFGPAYLSVRYGVLEQDRSDVKYPSLVGLRLDFVPSDTFTFGLSRMDIVGGQGRMLNRSSMKDFLFGKNADVGDDQWDTQAGMDFRWRLKNDTQVYGEVYGEDAAGILPSELSELAGVYFPRLSSSGDWDATLEWAHTRPCWYVHGVYTNGWTYKDNILGDAMGADALRYYAGINRYCPGIVYGVNLERVVQNVNGPVTQTVDSFWLSAQYRLAEALFVKAQAGVAGIKNANFEQGRSGHSYLASVTVSKEFF
ncbi:MAG: Capsule assembly protein Wzi [Firmicutes bacterium]|nr:Capsule assembly protein Wzi [Bacillota bacterium]